jgi:hypothetical protein
MRNGDWKKDQEGSIKHRTKNQSFSWCRQKEILKDPAEVDGKRKGQGKNDLKEYVDFESFLGSFNGFAEDKGTQCFKEHPVGEDHSKGKFIAEKRDEQFPHKKDLGYNTAYPHDEQRDL